MAPWAIETYSNTLGASSVYSLTSVGSSDWNDHGARAVMLSDSIVYENSTMAPGARAGIVNRTSSTPSRTSSRNTDVRSSSTRSHSPSGRGTHVWPRTSRTRSSSEWRSANSPCS